LFEFLDGCYQKAIATATIILKQTWSLFSSLFCMRQLQFAYDCSSNSGDKTFKVVAGVLNVQDCGSRMNTRVADDYLKKE
jgi:hypothetical protein